MVFFFPPPLSSSFCRGIARSTIQRVCLFFRLFLLSLLLFGWYVSVALLPWYYYPEMKPWDTHTNCTSAFYQSLILWFSFVFFFSRCVAIAAAAAAAGVVVMAANVVFLCLFGLSVRFTYSHREFSTRKCFNPSDWLIFQQPEIVIAQISLVEDGTVNCWTGCGGCES